MRDDDSEETGKYSFETICAQAIPQRSAVVAPLFHARGQSCRCRLSSKRSTEYSTLVTGLLLGTHINFTIVHYYIYFNSNFTVYTETRTLYSGS